jgi:hypothetical protein
VLGIGVWVNAFRTAKRFFGVGDDRVFGCLRGIELNPAVLIGWDIRLWIDGLYGAFVNTGIAVDAGFGVDVEAVRCFVKCFYGAHGCTVSEFAVDTGFGYDVGHD